MAAHSHDHSHAEHSRSSGHAHACHVHPTLRPSVLGWAMVATLGLVLAEVFGGILGRSVALLNDAVHIFLIFPRWAFLILRCAGPNGPPIPKKTTAFTG